MKLQESSLELWLLVSLLFVIRYLILAGIPFLFYYVLIEKKVRGKKIQKKRPDKKQILKEILYSLVSLLLYGTGIWLFLDWLQSGITLHYGAISDYGIAYFIVSFLLMVIIHDTYFYWTHRLIHHKKLFSLVHKVHHQFTNPTPWAAFHFILWKLLLAWELYLLLFFVSPGIKMH